MITGYNTDVRYREKVFHVQTEDKGLTNPFIESVVYHGGQVLVAKRSSYSDLIQDGKGSEDISARMDHQHRMMIAAIRAGKLDAKMQEALGPFVASGEETGIGAEAVGGLLEMARSDAGPTLDQVILEYLTTEAQQDQLELALDDSAGLAAGNSCLLQLRARSSRSGLPVSGAQVAVKMISTLRPPLMLGEGTTDEEGSLEIEVAIPEMSSGAAAVIISASSLIGSAELKQLL
ncbi:MAG TPA: hypothetical protein VMT16_16710 [Thermoanaerobaculia bacterium]|nr:hypothetical protein [Thermoanaerobaculia bacterium]